MSQEGEYDTGEDVLEEEDLCDYTGEQCIGDKMFCEECLVETRKEADGLLHVYVKTGEA